MFEIFWKEARVDIFGTKNGLPKIFFTKSMSPIG